MFEKFTEQARRVVFFARYEASGFGTNEIDTEHLLIGILREAKDLMYRPGPSHLTVDAVRARMAKDRPVLERVSTSVDMPLNAPANRAIACAAEESAKLGHQHIGVEHLLVGIAREETCLAAAILRESGLTVERLRQEAANSRAESPAPPEARGIGRRFAPPFVRDLTEAAAKGELTPLIGHDTELTRTIQILSRRRKNNVVLVGEPGVGKTAIVEGLAQGIAGGTIPVFTEYRVLAMDAIQLEKELGWLRRERNVVLCIESLFDRPTGVHMLQSHLSPATVRFIATGTQTGLQRTIEYAPVFARHFEAVGVAEPGTDDALRVLEGLKSGYEQFHGVTFGGGTLEKAIHASGRFLAHRCLPDRALDLMDEAAVLVKMRNEADAPKTVGPEDVEQVIAQRTGATLSTVKAILAVKEPAQMERVMKELAAGISIEGNEWVALLAAYLARSSKAEIEALAEAIRRV